MRLYEGTKNNLRKQHADSPADHDLCLHSQGVYIDVVLRFDNQWHATLGSVDLGYFDTRQAAVDALLDWKL